MMQLIINSDMSFDKLICKGMTLCQRMGLRRLLLVTRMPCKSTGRANGVANVRLILHALLEG